MNYITYVLFNHNGDIDNIVEDSCKLLAYKMQLYMNAKSAVVSSVQWTTEEKKVVSAKINFTDAEAVDIERLYEFVVDSFSNDVECFQLLEQQYTSENTDYIRFNNAGTIISSSGMYTDGYYDLRIDNKFTDFSVIDCSVVNHYLDDSEAKFAYISAGSFTPLSADTLTDALKEFLQRYITMMEEAVTQTKQRLEQLETELKILNANMI